jgi:hypothetical protein
MYSAWSGFGAPIKEGFQSQDNLVLSEEKDGFIFKKVGDKNKAMYWMKSLNDYAPISEPSCEINIDNEVIKCPSKFKKKVKKEYESRNNANGNGNDNGKDNGNGNGKDNDKDNDLVTESDSEESDSESEDEEENVANTEEQDVSGVSNNQSTSQAVDDESESEDEAIPTEQPTDEDEANGDEDDSDDDNVPTTALSEPFFGGKIEHFSNNGDERGFLSLHLFLKSIMIACLFYILAHPDSKQFILGKVFKNIKSDNYLYVAMVLFFIVFYVIGIFL